ncbi:hypothetical protein HWV62_19796 [Athelia sp. TMB]|nr:hypothetical protein HWV62_19796 [Athelia sp. TMB]
MADRAGPTVAAAPGGNKLAMSRALGAAFLNHQVEQLEKSVNGPGTGNWRDRDRRNPQAHKVHPNAGPRGGGGGDRGMRRMQPQPQDTKSVKDRVSRDGGGQVAEQVEVKTGRRSHEEPRGGEKDADVIVVDSSVLVHALYQVKKWCKDGRQEILIVPLEALNTLDLLKKGTSALAQRARAASRILEAQVGTNSRIRVQQDDAFVFWDKISFKDLLATAPEADMSQTPFNSNNSPEWLRRTICCARWEIDNARLDSSAARGQTGAAATGKPKVVLAVLASSPTHPSVQAHLQKRSDGSDASPVPLPAPSININKHEPRTAGTLVYQWATRADIPLIEVDPSAPIPPHQQPAISPRSPARVISEDERPKRLNARGRKNSNIPQNAGSGGAGLVERPPAVMAMMEMVAQPGPGKVVRLLARGEKLDPDP